MTIARCLILVRIVVVTLNSWKWNFFSSVRSSCRFSSRLRISLKIRIPGDVIYQTFESTFCCVMDLYRVLLSSFQLRGLPRTQPFTETTPLYLYQRTFISTLDRWIFATIFLMNVALKSIITTSESRLGRVDLCITKFCYFATDSNPPERIITKKKVVL